MTTPLVAMSSNIFSICSWYSMGTLCWPCRMGRTLGSVLMVYVLDMLPMVLKELGKALSNAIMSQTWAVEQGEVIWGDCTLRVDLVGPVALGERQCTRAGFMEVMGGCAVYFWCVKNCDSP